MAEQGKKKDKEPSKEPAKAPAKEPAGVNPTPVYIGGESIADRILPHIKKILIGTGVLAVVVTIFFTVRWYRKNKAEKATDHVINAVTDGRREIEEPSDTPPDPDEDTPKEVTFASRADRAEAVLADLKKANGDARTGVAMLEAAALLEAGHLDEAQAAYQKLAGKSGLEGVLAREALGFVAEARPDLPAALEAFGAMQTDDAGPRRAFALYHEGRILAQMGKKDEARTKLEAALDKAKETGESMLADMIDARITQLDTPPLAPKKEEPAPPADAPKGEAPPAEAPKDEPKTPEAPK